MFLSNPVQSNPEASFKSWLGARHWGGCREAQSKPQSLWSSQSSQEGRQAWKGGKSQRSDLCSGCHQLITEHTGCGFLPDSLGKERPNLFRQWSGHSFVHSDTNKDLLSTCIMSLAQVSYLGERWTGKVPAFMNLQHIHPKYGEQMSKDLSSWWQGFEERQQIGGPAEGRGSRVRPWRHCVPLTHCDGWGLEWRQRLACGDGAAGAARTEPGKGTSPGCVSGNSRRVRLGGGGAGSGLQPPWGDALSPKGKQGAESFVSKSLLGGARASS